MHNIICCGNAKIADLQKICVYGNIKICGWFSKLIVLKDASTWIVNMNKLSFVKLVILSQLNKISFTITLPEIMKI